MRIRQKRTASYSKIEEMTENLKQSILSGQLQAGDFLPSELALCKQYNLSNIAVRRGLEWLASEGYIEKIPRIGSRVLERQQASESTVRFGYYSNLGQHMHLFELVRAFHERYPHIRVLPIEIHYSSESRSDYSRVKNYMLAESIDVMMLSSFDFGVLSRDMGEGQIGDLLMPQQLNTGIYPFLTKPFMIKNRLFAHPFTFSPIILCYNKAHFHELELPEPDSAWTWEDVRQAGRKLSEGKNRYGLYFNVSNINRWPLFLLQNGVQLQRNKQGKYSLRHPELVKALEAAKALISDAELFPQLLSAESREETTLFLNQKVSMVLTTYDRLYALREARFAYDIAPLPYLHEPRTLLHTISLAISSKSQQKKEAQLFVDFLLSYETQLNIRTQTLRLPALKQAAEWTGDEQIANRPARYHLYREIIPTFRNHADLCAQHSDLTGLWTELHYYWSGLEDLETVLERLEEKL